MVSIGAMYTMGSGFTVDYPPRRKKLTSMWADVNALIKKLSLSEKERSEQRIDNFLNGLEQQAASFTDEQFARLKRIMDRRGRAAPHGIVVPIGTTLVQPSNPRLRCSVISFNTSISVCTDERTEDKMEPELGELESSPAGTGLEAPGQQSLSNWEMEQTTVDGCLFVDGSSDLGENTFFLEDFVIQMEPDRQTSTSFASSKTACPQTSRKYDDTELGNDENKQFDSGGKGGEPSL